MGSSTEAVAPHHRESGRARSALQFVLLIGLLVVGAFYLHSAATRDQIDYGVYRAGGHAILTGRDLYALRVLPVGLPFTYPPVSAVLFALFSLLSVRVGQVVWMAASLVGLAIYVRVVLQRYAVGIAATSTTFLLAVLLIVSRSFPVRVNLMFGQINVLIALLVVADLAGVLPRIPRGVMIGVAAALKLTPLFLLAYFVAVRRYRDAAVAAATFVAVTLLAFGAAPHASARYWFHAYFADARRTGGIGYISNQSINGVIVRLTGRPQGSGLWLPVAILTAAVVLWSVRRISPRRPWLAESIAMAAMLLLSPVSWIHHWILVLPFVVASFRLATEARCYRWLFGPVCALSAVLWFGLIWHVPNTHDREFHHTVWQFVVGNSPVLVLVVTMGCVLAATVRSTARSTHLLDQQ